METVVRMGEAAVSGVPGDVLACIGLGSCIGLVLVDRVAGVAALAHVMLPCAGRPDPPAPFKFADLAVPGLVERAVAAGALRLRLEAALVGGAAMFQFGAAGAGQDVGARNDAAVREQLEALRVPVRATATGGGRGRTVRVVLGDEISITVREAGGREAPLLAAIQGVAA